MKRTVKLLPIILILSLLFSFSEKQIIFYVSTSGNDLNIGTKDAPFATLENALEKVKEKRAEGNKSFVNINIKGGSYPISRTINISEDLSGISIQAYKNEKVVFTGGVTIPLSIIEKESGNRYKVDLNKAGITNFGKLRNVGFARPYGTVWGEIFVNKNPMHLSRWPNKGMVPMGKVLDAGSVPRNDDFSNIGGTITYNDSRINKWANEKDAWMAGYFMWGYADDMVKIANIDTQNNRITTASSTLYGYGYGKPWRQWYGVNILAELDEAGEYYIEREEGILCFISDEKEIELLEFSVLSDPFFLIQGANNVTIEGIIFECSRGLGIAMDNTTNVAVKECIFRNLGSLGITVGKGVKPFAEYRHAGTGETKAGIVGSLQQHIYANSTFNREAGTKNKITGCQFYNLGAGGVILGGGNLLTLEAGNNVVENCVFYNLNRIEKSYRPAVYLTGVGNKIRHCEIFNTPSMAIYLMFGNNNIIEYNYLHDVCTEAEDQGAIYYGRNPAERGNVIRYNYFENIPDHFNTCAIYHDDGACGMTVFGNVFYKAGKWNVLLGGGSDNVYQNNIFIGNKIGLHVDNRLQNWAKALLDPGGLCEERLNAVNYLKPPYSTQYPELVSYFDNPALPKRNLIENNVFLNVEQLLDGKKEWLDYKESNWETTQNRNISDIEIASFLNDFQSEVTGKITEFQRIEFRRIGIKKE